MKDLQEEKSKEILDIIQQLQRGHSCSRFVDTDERSRGQQIYRENMTDITQ